MRNFLKVADKVNTLPLLTAVMKLPTLWNEHPYRTVYNNSAHSDVDDIWLRFNNIQKYVEAESMEGIFDDMNIMDYPAMGLLTQCRPIIFDLMRLNEGYHLGRVIISRLPPGGKIDKHVDEGKYCEYFDRFHVILQADKGFKYTCGDESVSMRTGEIWWFNNQIEHSLVNNSKTDRISMIVDIGC